MVKGMVRWGTLAVAATIALGACSANTPSGASGGSGGGSGGDDDSYKIGLLLPETAVARYETKDKPYFEEKLKELCDSCELLYANANSDAAAQQDQAQSMLNQGVNVLVVDPFDGKAAGSIVAAAKAKNVPVVAYDRLISHPDLAYVISNDYEEVGKQQGQALVDKLKEDGVDPSAGGIVMLNGATTDNNAGSIKRGALSVIEGSGYEVLSSTDTWDPDAAQEFVAGQITKFKDKIVGIYSANDGNAGGAIAALHAANVDKMPPITGLDASLAGLQAILVGDQYMTVYNAFRSEAEKAAEVAYELAQGNEPSAEAEVDGHPASLNPPVAVTKDNIKDTVIADEFFTVDELCTAEYKDACAKAGIE
jgi:D-xylose transport system substrate-binding protein